MAPRLRLALLGAAAAAAVVAAGGSPSENTWARSRHPSAFPTRTPPRTGTGTPSPSAPATGTPTPTLTPSSSPTAPPTTSVSRTPPLTASHTRPPTRSGTRTASASPLPPPPILASPSSTSPPSASATPLPSLQSNTATVTPAPPSPPPTAPPTSPPTPTCAPGLPPPHALLAWYEQPGCAFADLPGQHRSFASVPVGLCNANPAGAGGMGMGGYLVLCDADGRGGRVVFCTSPQCESCYASLPFANGVCAPANPLFGSASLAVDCRPSAQPPQRALPRPGDFAITWYEAPGCAASGGGCALPPGLLGLPQEQHYSVVLGRQELCHVAPPAGGYRVTCRPDGSGGVYQVCRDPRCAVCDVTTVAFSNDQCVPNGDPAVTGAASANLRCAPPVPLLEQPLQPPAAVAVVQVPPTPMPTPAPFYPPGGAATWWQQPQAWQQQQPAGNAWYYGGA